MSQISSAKVKSRILEAKIPYGTVFPEKKYPRAVDTHQLIRKTGIPIDIEISLKTRIDIESKILCCKKSKLYPGSSNLFHLGLKK